MKRSSTLLNLLSLAAVSLVLSGISLNVQAGLITTPIGLNPGDSYRLAFVSSTTRNATSTDINDYNTFVTDVANTQALLVGLGTTWTAIGSTFSVDALNNTSTAPGTDASGIPIFLLDGQTKIADNYADLWDGSIDSPFILTEDGMTALGDGLNIFTGTNTDGRVASFAYLGRSVVRVGLTPMMGNSWISALGDESATEEKSFYALSDVLVVTASVPEPPASILLGLGLLGVAWNRKKRH